jgi:hypothetical protein
MKMDAPSLSITDLNPIVRVNYTFSFCTFLQLFLLNDAEDATGLQPELMSGCESL